MPLSLGHQDKEISGLSQCSNILNPLLLMDRTDPFLPTAKTQKNEKPSPFQNYLLTSHFMDGEKGNSLKEKKLRWDIKIQGLKANPSLPNMHKRLEDDFFPLWSQPSNFNYLLWSQQFYTASQNISRKDCFFLSPQSWWGIHHLHQVHCLLLLLFYVPHLPKFHPRPHTLPFSHFWKAEWAKITNSKKKQSLCFSDISPGFSVQYPKQTKGVFSLIRACRSLPDLPDELVPHPQG